MQLVLQKPNMLRNSFNLQKSALLPPGGRVSKQAEVHVL